jgi:hypothetical protein
MLAEADGPFVQPDTLQYLILSATHYTTQFGAEIMLIISDAPNKRFLKMFMPKEHARRFTHADRVNVNSLAWLYFLMYRGKRSILWETL